MATDRDRPASFGHFNIGHPQFDQFTYLEAGMKHQQEDGEVTLDQAAPTILYGLD
jgi:hypothetical protein